MVNHDRGSGRRTVPAKRKNRLSVSIIGAGRVGTALAISLRKAGHSIELVVAKHAASARKAQRLIGGKTIGLSSSQLRRLTPSQTKSLLQTSVFILSTPDDSISPAALKLAQTLNAAPADKSKRGRPRIALHTSGALPASALGPLKQAGLSAGTLHPLVSISDSKTGADWLARAWFSVEGEPAAVRAARRIARDIGGKPFEINPQAKALYHAAALTASPNMTALFHVALEMLSRCGLSRADSRKILIPLVESTIFNLTKQDPALALTGTFKRGDTATVRKHIAALKSADLREALAVYAVLGRHSLKLAGHPKTRAAEIENLLAAAFPELHKTS